MTLSNYLDGQKFHQLNNGKIRFSRESQLCRMVRTKPTMTATMETSAFLKKNAQVPTAGVCVQIT